MTDHEAEATVKEVLRLRSEGSKEDKQICAELKDVFNISEEEADWALEMISTGNLRAAIISNTGSYPKSNLTISSDPILKAAFKLAWIDLRGEDDYYKRWGNKESKRSFWSFWKRNK